MNLFGFGAGTPSLEITLDGQEGRKTTMIKDKQGNMNKTPVYTGTDDISGEIQLKMNKTKSLEHAGIRVQLIGFIEMLADKQQSSDFMTNSRELKPMGIQVQDETFKFAFANFEKLYESYDGTTAKIRYFVRVTLNRQGIQQKIVCEKDVAVWLPVPFVEEEPKQMIKLEVGIEDCLHIEFEYNQTRYHLKDCVYGKVSFLLVKIKLKYMELSIIKREIVGSGPTSASENETQVKYEVMDGCPHKNDIIPIRLYLGGVDLQPSNDQNAKFKVKHFINLVLVDDEDRRYFKQQEITIYRKK